MKDNKENQSSKKPKSAQVGKDRKEKKIEKPKKVVKQKKEVRKKEKLVSEVKAMARFIRISPRKVRLVVDQLENKSAVEALDYLKFVKKAAIEPIIKLVNSAIANAEHNFHLDKNDLYIKKFIVNDGPVLKRWRPRAYGRSTQISKRTSHLELILGLKPGAKQPVIKERKKAEVTKEKKEEVKVVAPQEVKKERPKVSGKGPEEKGRGQKGFFRRIFSRKTG